MFCPYSGYMLQFDPVKGIATCPQSGYTRRLEGAGGSSSSSKTVYVWVSKTCLYGCGTGVCEPRQGAVNSVAHIRPLPC
jgi:hypothetical protein